jgi:hypothetical protein
MASSNRPAARPAADLRAKIAEANAYLRADRDKFLTLSLGKFAGAHPGLPALSAQNLTEIAARQAEASPRPPAFRGRGPFGATRADRLRVQHAHALGEWRNKDRLMQAAHALLAAAVGADWAAQAEEEEAREEEVTAACAASGVPSPPLVVARLQYLTDCLWRYLALPRMTTYHLWSLLHSLKEGGVDARTDTAEEGPEGPAAAAAGLADCAADLSEALGMVVRGKTSGLEMVSAALQVLAVLPAPAAGSTMAGVVLDALDAFSRVPRVVDDDDSVKSKAERLRWVLEHGSAMEMAKRRSLGLDQASGGAPGADGDAAAADADAVTSAMAKKRRLEQDGATAAATLLNRFCKTLMSLFNMDSHANRDEFDDMALGARSAQLLTVLSKLGAHNTTLLANVSPLIFGAIQRSSDGADGAQGSLPPVDLCELGLILAKLPQDSGAFAMGASLLCKLDLAGRGAESLGAMLSAIGAGDVQAYVALAALQSSNELDADILLDAGAADILALALDREGQLLEKAQAADPTTRGDSGDGGDGGDAQQQQRRRRRQGPQMPAEILFSVAALASTDRGYRELAKNGGLAALLDATLRAQATTPDGGVETTGIFSRTTTAAHQAFDLATVVLLGPSSMSDSHTDDIFVVDESATLEALLARDDAQMQLAEQLLRTVFDSAGGSVAALLEKIREARDSVPLGQESKRYLTALAVLPRVLPDNYAEKHVVEKPPVGGLMSQLLNCPQELKQLSVLTAVPQYSDGVFRPREYDLDEAFVLMQQALHADGSDADASSLTSNEQKGALCAYVIANTLESLSFDATVEAVDSLDMGCVAEEAVRGINVCMGDDASVQSFLALLETLPPRVALARGAIQAARAAVRNKSTKLAGLHLIHTLAEDMARFEDHSSVSTVTRAPLSNSGRNSVSANGERKRRNHRGSVHKLQPRRQEKVEEDIAALIKSGGLQLAVDVMLEATAKIHTLHDGETKNSISSGGGGGGGDASTNDVCRDDRRLLAMAIDTIQIVARCDPASRKQLLEGMDISTVLAEIMELHAQTDQDLTSLAASTLAMLSIEDGQALRLGKKWKDGEGAKSGDAVVLSPGDARLAATMISALDGQDHNALMDVLGSEDYLSELHADRGRAASVDDAAHGFLMNSMVKNVVAQRLASDYANEDGIARLVSELDDPGTAPQRKNAVVTVLRRIADGQNRPPGVGQRRRRRRGGRHRGDYVPEADAASRANQVAKHLVDLKVAQKVAAALASSDSDDYRADCLHFLQSLTSNQHVDFGNQGLDASDLKLISENVAISRARGGKRHSQLLQSVDLIMENKLDQPADNEALFDAIADAASALGDAGDSDMMSRLRVAMGLMGGKFALDKIGESGGMGAVVRAIALHGDKGGGTEGGGQSRLLKWCKLMREFVRDTYWSQVLASDGGLIIAVQVIAKNMAAPKGKAEKKAQRVLRTDLVRVCCQLLADATFMCKSNAHHLLQLHIVRVIHGVLCNFPHHSAIVKAVSCLSINISHDDTDAQHLLAQGLLTKVVELLDEIMPHVIPLRGGSNVGGGTSEHNKHLEDEAEHAEEVKASSVPHHPPGLAQKNTQSDVGKSSGSKRKSAKNKNKNKNKNKEESKLYGVDMFRSTKDQIIARWMLSLCFCFSFDDRCAVEMIFMGLAKTACAGLRIASAAGNLELMGVCSNLVGNLIITALETGDTNATMRSHMVKRIWREETPDTVIQLLRIANDPGQLMLAVEILHAFVDDDSSSRRLLFAPAREYEAKTSHHRTSSIEYPAAASVAGNRQKTRKGRAAGLELVSLLLDRLTEFQWDLDFCEAGIKILARFAELEDKSSLKVRKHGGTGAAHVLVLAGTVQVLIGELEDCAMNGGASKLASVCLGCLDSISLVSADARRAIVNMGGTEAIAAVLMRHTSQPNELGKNVTLDALNLLTRLCIDSSLIPKLARDTIAAVMIAARKHSRDPKICNAVFVLLTLLAFEVGTLELIRNEEAIGFVIDALCAMPGEVELVKEAVTVLETIGTASPDHALIVVNEGGKMAIQSKLFVLGFSGAQGYVCCVEGSGGGVGGGGSH